MDRLLKDPLQPTAMAPKCSQGAACDKRAEVLWQEIYLIKRVAVLNIRGFDLKIVREFYKSQLIRLYAQDSCA